MDLSGQKSGMQAVAVSFGAKFALQVQLTKPLLQVAFGTESATQAVPASHIRGSEYPVGQVGIDTPVVQF
jgi:hypothetical protein